MIIFFHGYGSTSGDKAAALNAAVVAAGGEPIIAPRYANADEYFAAIDDACALLKNRTDPIALVAGSSMGGFAAYVVARRCSAMGVLSNPCLRPWDRLPLHGEDDWARRAREAFDALPPDDSNVGLRAIINKDDELFGDTFEADLDALNIHSITRFPHGGHRSANWSEEIVPEIVAEFKSMAHTARCLAAVRDYDLNRAAAIGVA